MGDKRPQRVADPAEWIEYAACLGMPTEMFYPEGRSASRTLAEAREVCMSCPVRRQCLAAALETPPWDDHGVWGGTTRNERLRLRNLQAEGVA